MAKELTNPATEPVPWKFRTKSPTVETRQNTGNDRITVHTEIRRWREVTVSARLFLDARSMAARALACGPDELEQVKA